jgi:Flp pilus assembly protein TadD
MSGAATSATPAATEPPEEALIRARAAAQAKRFGEAAGICNDVLAAAPDNAPALALQGMIAAHTSDPERGIALLERAVALRPGVASWYANLSALYRMVYRMLDALRVGQEAVRTHRMQTTSSICHWCSPTWTSASTPSPACCAHSG